MTNGINGGFGLMVQIPERVIQQAAEAFVTSQGNLFIFETSRLFDLTNYGINQTVDIRTQLQNPIVTLVDPDMLELQLDVGSIAHIQTQIDALPGGGGSGSRPPELEVGMVGRISIRVAGVFQTQGNKRYLALDLRALDVTSFRINLEQANVSLSPRALNVLSTIIRRSCIYILSSKVQTLPASWNLGTSIPILGPAQIELSYKIVANGGERAIALLFRLIREPVDVTKVTYALDQPGDVGVFLSLEIIAIALQKLCASLEGWRVYPDSGGIKGDLVFHQADIRVYPGKFRVHNIEIQSRTLQKVIRTIERILCTAIDPCNLWCRKVFETIVDWVQLDQLANAQGDFYPDIENGRLIVDAQHIDTNLSYPVAVLVFLASDALIPMGGTVAIVLMVIGKVLADRTVEGMIEKESWGIVVDQPLAGANLRVVATARDVTWPSGTFAIMSRVTFVPTIMAIEE